MPTSNQVSSAARTNVAVLSSLPDPLAAPRALIAERRIDRVFHAPLGEFLDAARLSSRSIDLLRRSGLELPSAKVGDLFQPNGETLGYIRNAPSSIRREIADRLFAFVQTAAGIAPASTPVDARPAIPLPPDHPQNLADWARAHGVQQLLTRQLPKSLLARFEEPQRRSLARYSFKLKSLFTDELRWRLGVPPDQVRQLRMVARQWLQVIAVDSGIALEEAQQRALPPSPEEPAAAALFAVSRTLRASLLQKVAPLRASAVIASTTTLEESPLALVISGRVNDPVDGPRDFQARVHLKRWREGQLSLTCCGQGHCPHQVLAVEALLDVLAGGKPELATLRSNLLVPEWRSVFRDIERAFAAPDAEVRSLLSWRVEVVQGEARLEPLLHARLADGGFGAGRRAAMHEVRLCGDWKSFPRAHRVEEILRSDSFGYSGITDHPYCHFLALAELDGYPHLVVGGGAGSPVRAVRRRLELSLRPSSGGYEIVPTLDGDPSTTDLLFAQLPKSHGGCVVHDRAAGQLVLVEFPEQELEILKLVRERRPVFPAEALESLLPRLASVEARTPLRLPKELEGEATLSDATTLLRLAVAAVGLRVEVRVRAGASVFSPGEGPGRLSSFAGGKRGTTVRDLPGEATLARERTAGLALASGTALDPWTYELGPDAALALVAVLEHAPREGLAVEWREEKRLSVTRPATAGNLRVAVEDRRDWFGLSGEIEIDGVRVDLARVFEAMRRGERYVQVKEGQFLALAEELRARLSRAAELAHSVRGSLEVGPTAADAVSELSVGAKVEVCEAWGKVASRLRASQVATPSLPATLEATLRPYQEDGFRWMMRLSTWGVGACLADDMGLGKTVQALAVLIARAEKGPAMVVAPTSVCPNWIAEAKRFAPSLRMISFRESDRAETLETLRAGDVLVASYGLVTQSAETLGKLELATLVIDEAQAVKNSATQRARAIVGLKADFRLALSGTPVENHLGELWSVFRALSPGLLGSWEGFRERFAAPIERERDDARRQALSRVVRPFMLRRTKEEVARELPPKTEIKRIVALSAEERELYETMRLAAVAELSGALDASDRPDQARFQVLAALTRLRQLACHPRLVDKASAVTSSKLHSFLELAEELRESGHRALVFSQFTSHLALVREALDKKKAGHLYLDGQTPEAERARLVERFQAGEHPLFLISLKAGGTGLNLTGADHVIHLDPWWNPAVEDQATDRAHRIGQQKPVTVVRLVAKGTIEEQILALHDEKRDLVEGILGGTDAAGKLSTQDLLALIKLGEAAPDFGEREEEAADVAERATDATRGGSLEGEASSCPLRALEAYLARRVARETLGEGPAKSYRRSVGKFLDWSKAGADPLRALTRESLAEATNAYLGGLLDGSIAGPSSEIIFARTALRHLERAVFGE